MKVRGQEPARLQVTQPHHLQDDEEENDSGMERELESPMQPPRPSSIASTDSHLSDLKKVIHTIHSLICIFRCL